MEMSSSSLASHSVLASNARLDLRSLITRTCEPTGNSFGIGIVFLSKNSSGGFPVILLSTLL